MFVFQVLSNKLTVVETCVLHFQVLLNKLKLGRNISQSVDHPRVHHQLVPDVVVIESKQPFTISQHIQDGLKARKHFIVKDPDFAAVQAIVREDNGEMYGKCDPRKHGRPSGY